MIWRWTARAAASARVRAPSLGSKAAIWFSIVRDERKRRGWFQVEERQAHESSRGGPRQGIPLHSAGVGDELHGDVLFTTRRDVERAGVGADELPAA